MIGLARKGFGASYIPVNPRRKSAYFDGWEIALQRYNQNPDRKQGKYHYEIYASRIIERAKNPQKHIPIEIWLK